MDLQKEKQKIEKALRVIELIETCNWQIFNFEKELIYQEYNKFLDLSGYRKKRITIMQGVKKRLENYYKNLIK